MSRFWRTSSVTLVGIFLEVCAFYMAFRVISVVIKLPEASLPLWLVFLAVLGAFLFSAWVQSLVFSRIIRGGIGLVFSLLLLLALSSLNTDTGIGSLGAALGGDARAAVALILGIIFLIILWWRGATMAYEEVSLDTVRDSFRWGLMVLVPAVVADSLTSPGVVNVYLTMAFFAVGLAGLSLARFSWEAGDNQVMPANWWVPIGVCVGGVILVALVIGALGMGGLDDAVQSILGTLGNAGLWLLKPVLLVVGGLAAVFISVLNWFSGVIGGGDLTAFEQAQQSLSNFREELERKSSDGGPPTALVVSLKAGALILATVAMGWILYRVFRFRRTLRRNLEVDEARESLFSWSRANQDLAELLSGWWSRLPAVGRRAGKPSEPVTPREVYHRLLGVADTLGRPRWSWETPKQHQGALRGLLPLAPVGHIIDAFQVTHYGQAEVDEAELSQLRQDLAAIDQFMVEQEQGE